MCSFVIFLPLKKFVSSDLSSRQSESSIPRWQFISPLTEQKKGLDWFAVPSNSSNPGPASINLYRIHQQPSLHAL